jgi:glycosyltransferase involved in cell wall biosynthesis
VIVGDGPGAPDLRKSAGGDADILLAGAKFGKDLVGHYALAGCFIMPSDNDTWGLVVNEALACRLPVIVSRGCGACETLVIEGKNGWTFSVGDAAALSRHLCRVAALPDSGLRHMQRMSGEIVAKWPLRRFSDSVVEMLDIRRKPRIDPLAWGLVFAWKGHITSW